MGWKIKFAIHFAVFAHISLSFHVIAEEPNQQADLVDGEYVTSTKFNDITGAGIDSVRVTPSLVIMADDPAYEQFRREYHAKSVFSAGSGVLEALGVDRTIFLAPARGSEAPKNVGQLFIFQNITEPTHEEAESSLSMMEFRREQIENLVSAARKKSQ